MAKTQAPEQDQSMEEILQSIRKIISEEGDPNTKPENTEPAGSDVLELTDVVQEEPVTVAAIKVEWDC